MLKILLIHNNYQYKGGEDTVLDLEKDMLLRNGHSVSVLSFDNKTIQSTFDKLKTGLNAIYCKASANALNLRVKEFLPDIIHVHNFFPIASPSIFYESNKLDVPIVMTLHNYRLICANALLFRNGKICLDCIGKKLPLNGIRHKCYRNSALETSSVTLMSSFHKLAGTWKNKVDRYIVLSEFARSIFISSSLGLNYEQMVIKPNFVEDPGISKAKREDFFLFVGRLADEKRIQTIIDSMQYHNYKVKIIGDGPYRKQVEAASSANSNIEYLGFQNKEFINNHLKRAKALLFTSVWYESMGMTILEAFAASTPVIASNLGVLSTLVSNGINGFLFKPGDSEDLATKIAYFERNPELMIPLYAGARKSYLNHFTPEVNYSQLINIYSDVILKKKVYSPE